MQKFIDWMERSMAPKMNKINNNAWIQTLKESMMQILPMVLVGSLVTILAILQDFIPNMPNLWTISNYTMGLVGLFVSFLIPFNYIEKKRLHKLRLIAGMTAVAMYAIIIRLDTPEALDYAVLGAGGMFVAIVVGIVAGVVFNAFGKFSFFKEDSSMPDFVREWFDNMLPVAILVFVPWLLVYVIGLDIFSLINLALSPLTNFTETLVGFTLLYFLMCFFYSMGISTWMLYSITQPIMLANIMKNAEAVAQGQPALLLNTSEVVFSGWIAIGGAGGTLVLCIMMLFARSTRLKSVAKAAIVPSILNINEPIVFGAVAWNPILMIPMWIHGLIVPIITYLWLKGGLATIPSSVFGFWYCPFPISTFIVSPGVGAMILLAIVVAIDILIYFPFFKVYDRQQTEDELKAKTAAA